MISKRPKLAKALVTMLFAVLAFNIAQAQMQFWLPDGTLLADGSNSINDVLEKHFPGILHWTEIVDVDDEPAAVIYKLFTNEPLFITTGYPERIEKYVASFDLQEFLYGWELGYAIETNIKNRITDIFLLETLGAPTDRVSRTDGTTLLEGWDYGQYRIALYLNNGVVTSLVEY